jgi:formylglycine-generating enzyme required for sulfatase activity
MIHKPACLELLGGTNPVSDANYPNEEKPQQWPGAVADISPTSDHPVQQVNWYDAVLFCNWLSRKEGRTPCYDRTGKKVKGRNLQKPAEEMEVDEWRLVPDGTGYRLPTQAEWVCACRAGTTSHFASGSDEEMLRKYAWFQSNRAVPGGSKLPNGWGLFDMHGNVWEWCQDWYGEYGGDEARDPAGGPSEALSRVYGGGGWWDGAATCQWGVSRRFSVDYRNFDLGFRPALSAVRPVQ